MVLWIKLKKVGIWRFEGWTCDTVEVSLNHWFAVWAVVEDEKTMNADTEEVAKIHVPVAIEILLHGKLRKVKMNMDRIVL